MNTIAATARKLAWRHWLLLPLMNLCICIPRRCSAWGTPQKKKSRRLLSARFLILYEASRLATPEGCRAAVSFDSTDRHGSTIASLLQIAKEMSEFRERRYHRYENEDFTRTCV